MRGDRNLLPSSHYDFGIAHILYYICFLALLVGGIWLLVGKIYDKRNGKQNDVERVLGRDLCLHGKEEVEYDQVDRPSANAQKGGHQSQQKPDHHAE